MKPAVLFLLSVFFILPACFAQAGAIPPSVTSPAPNGALRGIPPSVTSPTPDGRLHGIPSTITAPGRRIPAGRRVFFSDPQHRRHSAAVVPLFYSAYPYPVTDPGAYDPQQPPAEDAAAPAATEDQALRDAYNRGAQDALSSQQQDRYGQHYLDSRTRPQPAPEPQNQASAPQQAASAPVEDSTPTVFIFKDGHRIETNSYVIMGQTLFDFSSKPLKKIQMAELDLDATKKANDEIGNPLRF
jgi:hypothetical protein